MDSLRIWTDCRGVAKETSEGSDVGALSLPPWLLNPEYMSPLLAAYDDTLVGLRQELADSQRRYSDLRTQVDEVVRENADLHAKVRAQAEEALQKRMNAELAGSGPVPTTPAPSQRELVEAQELNSLLQAENDNLLQAARTSKAEVDRLRAERDKQARALLAANGELREAREAISSLEHTLHGLQDDKDAAHEALESLQGHKEGAVGENEALKQQIRSLRADVKAYSTSLEEYKAALEDVTTQRDTAGRELTLTTERERDTLTVLRRMETELEESIRERERLGAEIETLGAERDELLTLMAGVEGRLAEGEKKEYAAFEHVKESVELVEDVRLERDQAVLRQSQTQAEVERLRNVLRDTESTWQGRLNNALEEVKASHASALAALEDEARTAARAASEASANAERAMREKRLAEAELERARRDGPTELRRMSGMVEELNARAMRAERDRDEATSREGTMSLEMKRSAALWSKERNQLVAAAQEAQRRLGTLERDMEEAKGGRLKLLGQIDDLSRELKAAQAARDGAVKASAQNKVAVQEVADAKVRDLEEALSASRAAHARSTTELEDLVAAQASLTGRWKEEAKTVVARFESAMVDLKRENSHFQERVEELEVRVSVLTSERGSLLANLEDREREVVRLRDLKGQHDRALSQAQSGLSDYIAAEYRWMSEKKDLQRQIELGKMERARLGREVNRASGVYSRGGGRGERALARVSLGAAPLGDGLIDAEHSVLSDDDGSEHSIEN